MSASHDTEDSTSFETAGPLDNGWKLLRVDGRTWIVPDFTVGRAVFIGLATTFLVVCWGVAAIKGFDTLTLRTAVACTVVAGLQLVWTLFGLRRKERRGNYLEFANSRSIRLPRHDLTLSAADVDSILVTEGKYESNELSFRVLRLSIRTRSGTPSFVPVITTSHQAELERAARSIAQDSGVPVIRIPYATRE